jgi:hypothetical protein
MSTEKMIIKATFELPGNVQVRLVVLDGYRQKVQIHLGEDWFTFADKDAKPYVQMFELLCEFDKLGVTTFLHIKEYGLAGRIGILPDGTTTYFWLDRSRNDKPWAKATDEQIAEIDSYQSHVAALKSGDTVVVWKVTDVNTGQGKWSEGTYQYATSEGHWVLIGRNRLQLPHVLTLRDAVIEGILTGEYAAR